MSDYDYPAKIVVDDEELNDIFKKMEEAKEVIYDCCNRLRFLGLTVSFEKKTPPETTDGDR